MDQTADRMPSPGIMPGDTVVIWDYDQERPMLTRVHTVFWERDAGWGIFIEEPGRARGVGFEAVLDGDFQKIEDLNNPGPQIRAFSKHMIDDGKK